MILVCVHNHQARLIGPLRIAEPSPDRPPEDRTRPETRLVLLPGANAYTEDELAQLADRSDWERWQRIGWIEVRALTVEDSLMTEDEPDALELARTGDDHEQLCTWARNEWREPVRKVLVRRVEETEDAYLRKVSSERQSNIFNNWVNR